MKNEFEKNFTADGYLMNYEKLDKLLADKNKVLQFKIELKNISPLIWRRILVPIDCNFWDLHIAIQDAIGWYDAHLHRFEIKGKGRYNDMLNILFDPKNERHEEMKTWVGEDWDAEVFDSKKVRFTDPYKRWKEGFLS